MTAVTAETITDEQIRQLQVSPGTDFYLWTITRDALLYHEGVEPYASLRRDARDRCAAAWNARGGKDKP